MSRQSVNSRNGTTVVIDGLQSFVSPEDDVLSILYGATVGAGIRPLGGGLYAVTPDNAGPDNLSINVAATDGLLDSLPSQIDVSVSPVTYIGLQIENPDVVLQIDSSVSLDVVGLLSDGTTEAINTGSVVYVSHDPNVAVITDSGQLIPVAEGFATIEVRAFGLTMATSVAIGVTANPKVDFYPTVYTTGVQTEKRKLIVREQVDETVFDRSTEGSFFVEDPSIGQIDSEGNFVGLQEGSTRVIFVYNGHTQVATFDVVNAIGSQAIIADDQALILESPEGIQLGIPENSLPSGTQVSVKEIDYTELPFEMPFGFDPKMALDVDLSGVAAENGLSLSVPTPAGLSPGDEAWLFTASQYTDSDGNVQEAWLLADRMLAGDDGRTRTTSPPHPTLVFGGPAIIMGAAFAPGVLFGISRALQGVQVTVESPFAGGLSKPYYTIVGLQSTNIVAHFLPVPPSQPVKVTYRATNRNGQSNEDVRLLEFTPGEEQEVIIDVAPPPAVTQNALDVTSLVVLPGTAPSLQVNYKSVEETENLRAIYKIGERTYTGPLQQSVEVDDGESYLLFDIPNEVTLASAEITFGYFPNPTADFMSRTATTKKFKVTPEPRYVFAALANPAEVEVIDARATITFGSQTIPNPLKDETVAHIPLAGIGAGARAIDTATTIDDGRVYVVSSDSVSVIDTLTFQQIDVVPGGLTSSIRLPVGASPFRITTFETSPGRGYAYITDRYRGNIYVVDIDPLSPTYNELMSTIAVPDSANGLTGIAIDHVTQRLFVAAPGGGLFRTQVAESGAIHIYDLFNPTFPRHEKVIKDIGIAPYDISTTTEPNSILVTDQLDDSQGLISIRFGSDAEGIRLDTGSLDGVFIERVDLRDLGLDPGKRGRQTFGVSNATGVVYIPEDAYFSKIGPHPAYALITGYNRNVVDDPKHDHNGSPLFIRNALGDTLIEPSFLTPNASTRTPGFSINAGSNIGLIRDPLGIYGDPELVAATRPTPLGFPDNLAVAGLNVYAAFRGSRGVFVMDASQMIRSVERGTITVNGVTNVEFDAALLNRIPVNDLNRDVDVRTTQFVQYVVQGGSVVGFVNPNNPEETFSLQSGQPDGPTATTRDVGTALVFASYPPLPPSDNVPSLAKPPLAVGPAAQPGQPTPPASMPAGVSAQTDVGGIALDPRTNPYNLRNNRCDCTEWKIKYEVASDVEGHSGALTESVSLTPYNVAGLTLSPTLVYDSERASSRPIIHVGMDDVDPSSGQRVMAARVEATRDGDSFVSPGFDPEEQGRINPFIGGENFFRVPESGGKVEAAVQLNLTDAPSGIYTLDIDQGVYANSGVGFVGSSVPTDMELPHVNSIESPFGAGWGLQGWKE
ncbi:MAG: hypothetical protein KDB00_16935, partial [Planctomycetales bacterium]|nr:hypothetical protein [Planctomycetales bacterium]